MRTRRPGAARVTIAVVVLAVVLGALAAGAWFGLGDASDEPAADAPARDSARRSPARTAPPVTAPPPPPTTLPPGLPLPLVPRPARIAWAGDSVSDTLVDAVAAHAAPRGVEVLDRTTSGCGLVRGQPADDALVPIDFVRACDAGVPRQNAGTAAVGADVVVWLSTWETANRVVDGTGYVFGTPEADGMMLGLIDESAQQLMAGGARLVFLTMPPNTTGPNRPVLDEAATLRALHLNALLRQYAAAHADRVAVLDLAEIVCPGGPPCPTVVEGVTLRPVDGGHFAGDGPDWVAPRVLDRLVGP
jgi:hypothetical protein